MNNIFANSTNFAVALVGQAGTNASIGTNGDSQLQYDLFFNNVNNNTGDLPTANPADLIWNTNARRLPGQHRARSSATRSSSTRPTAISVSSRPRRPSTRPAARSDRSPSGDMIFPTVRPAAQQHRRHPHRPHDPAFGETPGRATSAAASTSATSTPQDRHPAGLGQLSPSRTSGCRPFRPTPAALTGPATAPGTYQLYVPISGQRELSASFGSMIPTSPNTGFGKSPFLDIGAFEYVNLHPPQVTARHSDPGQHQPAPVNFYAVGGKSGANQTPTDHRRHLHEPDRPQLDQRHHRCSSWSSGGDAIFGSQARPSHQPGRQAVLQQRDQHAGRSTWAAAGSRLNTDAYRLILLGSGSQRALAAPQGIALDGENTDQQERSQHGGQLPAPLRRRLSRAATSTTPSSSTPRRRSSPAGTFQLDPDQRHEHRRRLRHRHEPAQLHRHDHRAQPDLLCPWPARPRSSMSASPCGRTASWSSTSTPPAPSCPCSLRPAERRHSRSPTPTATSRHRRRGRGRHRAGDQHQPLRLDSPYNVGLQRHAHAPCPATDAGSTWPGPGSSTRAATLEPRPIPTSTANFVVDTDNRRPSLSPARRRNTRDHQSTAGPLVFTVKTSENIDLTHFTTSQIQLLQSAPNGSFTGTGVTTIPINSNISCSTKYPAMAARARHRA